MREKGGQAVRHKGIKAAADIIYFSTFYSLLYCTFSLLRTLVQIFFNISFYKLVILILHSSIFLSLSCCSPIPPPTSWIAALPSRLCISCLSSDSTVHSADTMYRRHQSMCNSMSTIYWGIHINHYRVKKGKSTLTTPEYGIRHTRPNSTASHRDLLNTPACRIHHAWTEIRSRLLALPCTTAMPY